MQGFTHFVLNRTEYKLNSKRSSGGIVLYLRDSLIKQDSNPLFKPDSDDIIWLKLDNNNSVFSNELYICLCYNVPSGTSRQSMIDSDIFYRLTQHIEEIKHVNEVESKFIVCGDFNARIGYLKDYVPHDIGRHIDALPDDYIGDTALSRSSSDSSVNDNGTLLIDFCIQTGLRVANGRVGEDATEGKCTYVGSNGSSLIDYVIVSEDLLEIFSELCFRPKHLIRSLCC